jgi:two-component system cell cycle response regulator DivK
MKILVVEDQAIESKLAVQVLRAAGHDVSTADAAEQALAAIRESHPDVILMDMSLPGMDGLTLIRKLKADPETGEIQIVAVTSYPEKFPREAAMDAGCDAYLGKPLSTRTLPATLTDIVNNGGGLDR